MTYRPNRLAQKLDRLAEFTGVPAFSRRAAKDTALPYRFVPLLPLAVAVMGLMVQIRVPEAGWVSMMGAWIAIMPMLLTGPMRVQPGGALDERERALVQFGRLAGLGAVALVAVGGCFLFGLLGALSVLGFPPIWTPRLPGDWLTLGFFMIVLYSTTAVLAVSWKMPRVPVTDEDD